MSKGGGKKRKKAAGRWQVLPTDMGKKRKKRKETEMENNKTLYLSRAELSSSSRWASDVVLPSLDRESILFIMTSSMSLIFLRTPRDSTPPSTGEKESRGEALAFTG